MSINEKDAVAKCLRLEADRLRERALLIMEKQPLGAHALMKACRVFGDASCEIHSVGRPPQGEGRAMSEITQKRVRSIVGCELTTGEREVLYLVPVCKRCGHAICPCCGDWCDACFDRDFDNDDIRNAEGPDFHPECAETS